MMLVLTISIYHPKRPPGRCMDFPRPQNGISCSSAGHLLSTHLFIPAPHPMPSP